MASWSEDNTYIRENLVDVRVTSLKLVDPATPLGVKVKISELDSSFTPPNARHARPRCASVVTDRWFPVFEVPHPPSGRLSVLKHHHHQPVSRNELATIGVSYPEGLWDEKVDAVWAFIFARRQTAAHSSHATMH